MNSAFDPYFENARRAFEEERTKRLESLVKMNCQSPIFGDREWAFNEIKKLLAHRFSIEDMKSL